MSTVPTQQKMTEEEYLALERASETRSEFYDGVMYPMDESRRPGCQDSPRGCLNHARVSINLASSIYSQLQGRKGEVFCRDIKVILDTKKPLTYPDLVAVNSAPRFDAEKTDLLLNPALIIEVTSVASESCDYVDKMNHYFRIESLKEYVLVPQEDLLIRHFSRNAYRGEWMMRFYSSLDEVLELESIGCAVPLSEIYARIDLRDDEDEVR